MKTRTLIFHHHKKKNGLSGALDVILSKLKLDIRAPNNSPLTAHSPGRVITSISVSSMNF